MSQFHFLDPPTTSNSLRLPVSAGQSFIVALEFLTR